MPQAPPKRRKPSKTLDKAARQVKDADDFVEHIGNIADRYRREHALDAGPRGKAVKQAINAFRRHSTALAAWLQQAHKDNQSVPERDALDKIGIALHGAPGVAQAQSKDIESWLERAGKAAEKSMADAKRQPRNAGRDAPRMAAEGLRATFEHHKLKFSTQIGKTTQSDAVRLLCGIAKHAGDAAMTPQIAKQALIDSGSGRKNRSASS